MLQDGVVRTDAVKHVCMTFATLLCCSVASAQTPAPERKVVGTAVTSRDPAIRVSVPKEARYIGADRWPLHGVADCEIHVFVEADASKRIQRLYWIQFEAFLPTQPGARYDYDRDAATEINGFPVRHRERFGATAEKTRAGSDLEHVKKLVAAAGYTWPAEAVNARLVHLPDDTRRREVMVIYIEDMASTGKTSADFLSEGKVSAAWTPVAAGVLERAKARVTFERVSP
jgi:hypothetical protein